MTTRDPNDLGDPRLDAAWRAASREEPPSALDDAIRAAARREVGAGPQGARRIPEALRPERWWWPLAAAATIGAVAIGLLQLAPPEKVGAPADDKAATDMPAAAAPATKQLGQAAREETPAPLRHEAAKPSAAAPSIVPESPGNAQLDRVAPPHPIALTPPVASGLRKDALPRTHEELASTQPPASSPPRSSASAPAELEKNRQAGAESDTPAQHAAEPFPADAVKREWKEELAGGGASPARNRDEIGAAAATGKLAATPAPPPASPARDAQRAGAPVAQPSAPAPAMAARRAQVAEAPRANAAADAGAALFAEPKPDARAKVQAKLPVADWIALIRKLRDEGRVDEAAKELAAFRAAHPDHERLLPPDLRDWRPAAK